MQRTRLVLRIGIFWMLAVGLAHSQVSRPIAPRSFNSVVKADVATVKTSLVDHQRLLDEDRLVDSKDIPRRFGIPFEVNYTLENSGDREMLPSGGRLWRLRIESPGAYSINLVYRRFRIPPGATFHIYNADRSVVLGAFTDDNNPDNGKFASAPVPGDVCILEYFEPAGAAFPGEISIERIIHAYRDLFVMAKADTPGYGESGPCNINVNCPEGLPWQDQKRALAMIITQGGWRLCSGALINNARQDLTPYFLTANHCLGDEETWVFMFNYESPDCNDADGPLWMTTSGAGLLSTNVYSDFALLQLTESPPDTYNVFYSGWSAVDDPPDSAAVVHHPSGDIKKISFDDDSLTSTAYMDLPGSGNSHWRVGTWEAGTTEPGSSGAPLFDPDHRLIGQLHGGYASCDNISSDWFGKFSQSWSYGNEPASRLRDWLDPEATGILTLDGREATGVTVYHIALVDTRETVLDYEIRAVIVSNCELAPGSLLLTYLLDGVPFDRPLSSTAAPDEYEAVIPAQPAGSDIYYYLTAADVCGDTVVTDTLHFRILDNGVTLAPGSLNDSARADSVVEYSVTVVNTGAGANNYDLEVSWRAWPATLWYQSGDLPISRTGYLEGGESLTFMARVEIPASLYGEQDTARVTATAVLNDSISAYAVIITTSLGRPVTVPFVERFDDTLFDRSRWTITSTSSISAAAEAEPSPAYSLNLNGDPYGTDTLLSQIIDLSGQPALKLTYFFQQGGNGEDPETGDDLLVEYLDAGLIWRPLDRQEGAGPSTATFERAVQSLPGNAYHAGFLLRFRSLGDSGPFDDWFVDDISIEPAPAIVIEPTSIAADLYIGDSGAVVLRISNAGMVDLEYSIDSLPGWLTFEPAVGVLGPLQIDSLTGIAAAATLDTGLYIDTLVVASNDPDSLHNPFRIPVTLEVLSFICGDVNEDLKGPNLSDITALVSQVYLDAEPPSHPAAANVNGSIDGKVNLSDITYLVGYVYLGGSEPACR